MAISFRMNMNVDHSQYEPYHRALRVVCLCAWIPAFALTLAHGIISHQLFPVLGIIPMTFSAFIGGLAALRRVKRSPGLFLVDVFVAGLSFAFLIPSWVGLSEDSCHGWRYCGRTDPGLIMVATYGTVPMMLNFGIHLYFVLYGIYTGMPFKMFAEQKCPHCHGDLGARRHAPRAMSERSSDSKESYQPVNMIDHDDDEIDRRTEVVAAAGPAPAFQDGEDSTEPRPSTDDETARLV